SRSILKLYYAMRKTGLISSNNTVSSTKDMQVLNEQSKAYFNFINSLRSESKEKIKEHMILHYILNFSLMLIKFQILKMKVMHIIDV
ncbi:MAG: hypothetical protein ACM3ZS_06615, partial [Nitrososphaerota archaeon]